MFVDVLVVGGGLQGLVVLRALTDAGYQTLLVTDQELGSGQTLHAHGLLDSGTGLVTGSTRAELVQHVLPELRRLALTVRSDAPSFLALPAAVVEQVRALWAAQPDPPQPVTDAGVPGLRLPRPLHRVTAHHLWKTALVAVLVGGLDDRVVRGHLVDIGRSCSIRPANGGTTEGVSAGVVVVAAGCGIPRLLAETLRLETPLLSRLGHVRTHMICLRAPAGVLPVVGTVVTADLGIVAHQRGDGASLWYVTPQVGQPERVPVVPDNGHADVDPGVVSAGVAGLRELVPALAERDSRVEATVFAGYKQDVDGQMTQRLVEALPTTPPVIVAVPSVYAGAWANARDVVELVAAMDLPRSAEPPPALGWPRVPIGQENEARPGVRWDPWQAWADA